MKESYKDVLVRLDERLKNLIESNEDQHKEIIDSVNKLCSHVNDENQKMDKRISKLEDSEIVAKATTRTLKYVVGFLVGAIGLISTVLGILGYLGVI